jgi:DNA-binding NarL/FixJ family response regulator
MGEESAIHTATEEPAMIKPRVLLADHRLVAEGLEGLLKPHFQVVGIVSDGRKLVESAKRLAPEVIVLDVSIPSLNGIDVARQIRTENLHTKLVFLTVHCEVAYAARAMESGASGYVLKHSAVSELLSAIWVVLHGGTYITPQIAEDLSTLRREVAATEPASVLTLRQLEVLRLVVNGRSAKEIATVLQISRRTAEYHKARLMEALGVQTTAELIRYALHAGIG